MDIDGWRPLLLVREAVRNVTSRRSRMFPMLVITALLGVTMAGYFVWESAEFEQRLHELGQRGRNVLTLGSANAEVPAAIDRLSCEALAQQPGIDRSGVIVADSRRVVLPLGDSVQLSRASVGLVPQLAEAPVVIGSALVGERATGPRSIVVDGGPTRAVIGARQPEGVDVNSGITSAALPSDRTADNCTVVLDRYVTMDDALPAIAAGLRSSGPPLIAAPALTESTDTIATHLGRPTRWLPLAFGALGGAVLGALILARGSELAAYRLSGTSRTSLLTLVALEALLLGGLAGASAALASFCLGGSSAESAARASALGAAVTGVGIVISLFVVLRRPNDLAKER